MWELVAQTKSEDVIVSDPDWRAIEASIKLKYPEKYQSRKLDHSGSIAGDGILKVVFEDIETGSHRFKDKDVDANDQDNTQS